MVNESYSVEVWNVAILKHAKIQIQHDRLMILYFSRLFAAQIPAMDDGIHSFPFHELTVVFIVSVSKKGPSFFHSDRLADCKAEVLKKGGSNERLVNK